MLARSWVAFAVALVGCGGSAPGPLEQEVGGIASAGTAGAPEQGGAAAGGKPSAAAGEATGGTAAGAAGAATAGAGVSGGGGGSSSSAGSGGAGAPQGGGGAAGAGGSSGGTSGAAAGTGGAAGQGGTGGSGGSAQAGAGGSGGDPLKPKPVPGCPGYVEVLVPKGTCVWFHGSFSIQSSACDITSPPVQRCAIASAPGKDVSGIISDGVEITRLDFDATGCPKACQ